MKIVLIGVGSICFGAKSINDLIYYKDTLAGARISLVDIDQERLELMAGLARQMNQEAGSPFVIEQSAERAQVLEGADFVITSPAIRREELWEQDWDVLRAAGCRQTYGENGGPGSLFLTLRNIPMMLDIAKDIERLAPGALLINFTKPEARVCMALNRYSKVRTIGLCHQIYEVYNTIHHVLGIAKEQIDVKAAGINHLTWIYDIRDKMSGKSIHEEFIRRLDAMPEDYEPMSRMLYKRLKMYPTAGDHHLAEFLAFGWEYQGLEGRNFARRKEIIAENLAWLKGVNHGSRRIDEVVRGKSSESVADIIQAIVKGDNHYEVSLDLPNRGCIPNLPLEAIVEVPGVVSPDAIRGLRMDPLPEPIAELIRRQITVQSLSVDAAVLGSRELALQAFMLDPVSDRVADMEGTMDRLLKLNAPYIHENFAI